MRFHFTPLRRLAVVLPLVVLALAACAPEPATDPGDDAGKLKAWTVVLPDGRSVVCVASVDYRSGVDCDWDSAS